MRVARSPGHTQAPMNPPPETPRSIPPPHPSINTFLPSHSFARAVLWFGAGRREPGVAVAARIVLAGRCARRHPSPGRGNGPRALAGRPHRAHAALPRGRRGAEPRRGPGQPDVHHARVGRGHGRRRVLHRPQGPPALCRSGRGGGQGRRVGSGAGQVPPARPAAGFIRWFIHSFMHPFLPTGRPCLEHGTIAKQAHDQPTPTPKNHDRAATLRRSRRAGRGCCG